MEMKKEFIHMVDRMGLEDGELALAEIVWKKAERAMQGMPTQEPVLLKPERKVKKKEKLLTNEEIQFLTGLLKNLLCRGNLSNQLLKDEIQQVWLACNPEDENTKDAFEALNILRSYQRKVYTQFRKLEQIQSKLKKQR
jgi:hypothetical protein